MRDVNLGSLIGKLRAASAAPEPAPAPEGLSLDKIERVARAAIDASAFPGPWHTAPDGRRYRVASMAWVPGRGVVPEIEWETTPTAT